MTRGSSRSFSQTKGATMDFKFHLPFSPVTQHLTLLDWYQKWVYMPTLTKHWYGKQSSLTSPMTLANSCPVDRQMSSVKLVSLLCEIYACEDKLMQWLQGLLIITVTQQSTQCLTDSVVHHYGKERSLTGMTCTVMTKWLKEINRYFILITICCTSLITHPPIPSGSTCEQNETTVSP